MKFLHIAILVMAASIAFPAAAQTTPTPTDTKILLQKLKADKKLLVSTNLKLSEAEAKGFWPVYDAYQKDLEGSNKRIATMVATYAEAYRKGPIPDGVAKKILDESIAIDEDEGKLKRAMVAKLDKVVPGAVIARYVQIENKIRALIRFELAEAVPLVY